MCQGCVQHFFVHYAYTTDSSTQTDESLCVPFIKGDVHCLTVLGLEVKYKEHKHRDHTAGCRPPGRLPPARPAATRQAGCSRCSSTQPLTLRQRACIFSVSL